jgi:hypothetical protein
VLLALNGQGLTREILDAALRRCLLLNLRLDILVSDPPRPIASLLAVLLLQLEHSGVDYRIASTSGNLAEAVLRYLRRYRGPFTIIVDSLDQFAGLPEPGLKGLRDEGHRFVVLTEPE